MSITLGETEFEGPFPMEDWNPPRNAAVYAIMMKPDSISKPNTYRPIYFGESGNLADRGFLRSHEEFGCWINAAGSTANLYIGIRQMPGSTASRRRNLESKLVAQYGPTCND